MKWAIREHKAMMVMAAGAIFYAGWISSAAHFNLAARWQNEHKLVALETQVVPKLKTQLKQANCDKGKIAQVAVLAVANSQGATNRAPEYSDITGCAPVAPVKAPPVASVVKK